MSGVLLVVSVAGCCLLGLLALLAAMRGGGRHRPRPGYIRTRSRVSSYTSPRTVKVLGTSTGCRPDGLKPVDRAGRALHHRLSRSTASGFSTDGRSASTATAGFPGDRTRPKGAVSPDPLTDPTGWVSLGGGAFMREPAFRRDFGPR